MPVARSYWFRKGIVAGIPIALGYFAVSFSFGIVASNIGLSPFEASIISISNLTSAGQFAGIEIIASLGSYFELFLCQLVINMRYFLMSIALSQKLDKNIKPLHRFLMAYGVTDEIFAVSVDVDGCLDPFFNYGAMLMAIPGWTLGTFFGATLGNILPEMIANVLSLALYAMFIAIVIPKAKTEKSVLYAVITACLLSSLFSYLPLLKNISSGFVIVIITVVVSALAAYFAPLKDDKYE